MKHLRKFNESGEESLDVEYIKHCFIDLVDNDDILIDDDGSNILVLTYKGFINSYDVLTHRPESIDNYIDKLFKLKKDMELLSRGIKLLKDEYPDYKIKCVHDSGISYGEIVDYEKFDIIIEK